MGISYKNSSGYPDPTAYNAVKNIEEEEKILHIQYPSGYMDIRMDAFFPCTVDRARKAFRLICQYCPKADRDRLLRFLQEKERRYKAQQQTFKGQLAASTDKTEKRQLESRLRESVRLQERIHRNIEEFLYREERSR